jgi:hypothetical protein
VSLFGKSPAPDVRSAGTYAVVASTAATVAFASYYLNNGLSWGEITGNRAAEAAAADATANAGSGSTSRGTDDPRRTGGGFEFPAENESGATTADADDNPVADHPVVRRSGDEQEDRR